MELIMPPYAFPGNLVISAIPFQWILAANTEIHNKYIS